MPNAQNYGGGNDQRGDSIKYGNEFPPLFLCNLKLSTVIFLVKIDYFPSKLNL